MHTQILIQVLSAFFDWFMNFSLPWDATSFTLFDMFTFCCVLYVVWYFIYHLLLSIIHIFHAENFDKFGGGD